MKAAPKIEAQNGSSTKRRSISSIGPSRRRLMGRKTPRAILPCVSNPDRQLSQLTSTIPAVGHEQTAAADGASAEDLASVYEVLILKGIPVPPNLVKAM